MGGHTYDRDVGSASSLGSFSSGTTSSNTARVAMSRRSGSSETDPRGKVITSHGKASVVIVLDVTGSNIEFARIVYDKAPMLFGQIEQQGYLPSDFDISFIACGDANSDEYPLQVTDFARGLALDENLKKLYLERGGGGQTRETYELAAYYLTHSCRLGTSDTPICCIIADESPYEYLTRQVAQSGLGIDLSSVPSTQVFAELLTAFKDNVFVFVNPYSGQREPQDPVSDRIYDDWCRILGRREQVIKIAEEKSIVDLILGVIALASRKRDLAGYLSDMKDRGQTAARQSNVAGALNGYSKAVVPVSGTKLPIVAPSDKRSSGSKRF